MSSMDGIERMISNEEFQIMVDELLVQNPPSSEMLAYIAERHLRSWVRKWCAEDTVLSGRGFEDDIMQLIHLRLMKTVVSKFLLKEVTNGCINYDPKGFEGWLHTVGRNITRDYADAVRRRDFRSVEVYDNLTDSEYDKIETSEEKIEKLQEAFSIAVASNKRIYIVLTWMSEYIFMLSLDISKIKANDIVLAQFENTTLFEMNDMLMSAAKKIPWLNVTGEQRDMISGALNKSWDNDRVWGEVKFSEFLMKKGGKKAISDWMNRMNNYIKRVMENGTSEI